jgi:hypothetical protein
MAQITDEPLPSFSSGAAKLLSAAVGLFGISGILYAVGFVALRSHFSFLGIWGGVPLTPEQIAEEGGRFFYALLYGLISPFTSIFDKENWVISLSLLVAAVVICDLGPTLHLWFHKIAESKPLSLMNPLRFRLPTLFVGVIVVGTAAVLESEWVVADYYDVARFPERLPCIYRDDNARGHLYGQIVWRVLISAIFGWILYRWYWLKAPAVRRGIILAQWLFVLSGIAMLPMTYGRLALPTSYPSISFPSAASAEGLLLVGETAGSWVVWDPIRRQTVIFPRIENERVAIGVRHSLLPL